MKYAANFLSAALVVILISAFAPVVHGQMVFDQKFVQLKSEPDTDLVTAVFPFTIKGDKPVTITEYEAACSCLSAEISDGGKLVWKPGETGVVKGLFKMGTFRGTVEKKIVLRYKSQQPEVLVVRVDIPILFELSPPTIFWDQNGPGDPQSFKIKVNHDKPIKITDVTLTNDQFDHEVKTIKDGWEYEVVITPKSVADREFGVVRIRNDCEFKLHDSVQGFVVIKPARRPTPSAPTTGG